MPPIEPSITGNRQADIAATMQAVTNALEEMIRRRPDQWFMFRRMWPDPAPMPIRGKVTPALDLGREAVAGSRLKVMVASVYRRSGARVAYRLAVQTVRAVAALL